MAVIDFLKFKKKKSEIGLATKIDYLIRKTTQFVIDHDYVTGNLDTLGGIQERVLKMLDNRIKSVADINKIYKLAIDNEREIKKCK